VKQTIILDDLFDDTMIKTINTHVLNGTWKFVPDMSYGGKQHFGFNQTFKHPSLGVLSPLYEQICVPIINTVTQHTGIQINDIAFTRAFLQVPLADKYYDNTNGVHIDLPEPHYACVYYCDDSDGETIVYEQTAGTVPCGSTNVDLTVHKTVEPKRGRVVLFDGFRYHCSSQPRNSMRCIINFNLI
jgi:hypothetical protein